MNISKRSKGFTLIELMIVVAIIGILAGIAYPSYQDSVTKSRRSDVMGALMGFANAMERHYTVNGSYCDAAVTGGTAVTGCGGTGIDEGAPTIYATEAPLDSSTKLYDLTIQDASSETYVLRATPKSGGTMADDGYLEVSSTGVRSWDKNNDADTGDTGENNWD